MLAKPNVLFNAFSSQHGSIRLIYASAQTVSLGGRKVQGSACLDFPLSVAGRGLRASQTGCTRRKTTIAAGICDKIRRAVA